MIGFLIKEAVSSVALEHPDDCRCDVCLAADGDVDAFARVLAAIAERRAGDGS